MRMNFFDLLMMYFLREKIMVVPRKEKKREARREEKAEKAAVLDKSIENELLESLKKGVYGDIYNYPVEAYDNILKWKGYSPVEPQVEHVEGYDELEEEEDMEDFGALVKDEPLKEADYDDMNGDDEEMDPSDQPVAKKMRRESVSDSGTKWNVTKIRMMDKGCIREVKAKILAHSLSRLAALLSVNDRWLRYTLCRSGKMKSRTALLCPFSHSSMALPSPLLLPLATVLLLFLRFPPPANSISDQELDAAISALRSRGYNLFGNAITTSDLRFDLLHPNSSYTLFAPTDTTLFALDMASSAAAYVRALRHHIALRRLPLPALRALPSGYHLPTLTPRGNIAISRRRQSPNAYFVTADGVDVVLPGIFYGQDVAVHGLAGILPPHCHETSGRPVPPSRSSYPHLPPCLSADPANQWSPAPSPTAGISPVVPETQTPAPTPDLHPPPYLSADPPDKWHPAPSPTADLSPMVPETQTPAPTPGSRSTFPVAVPPSYVDGVQPPMEPGVAPDVPSGISPAMGVPVTAEVVSPGVNPPERMPMNSPAASPTEIVSPGGNPLEGIPVSSPAASPKAMGFSWNGGVRLSSRIAACGEAVVGEEGCGLVAGHRDRPRPRPHASDDVL
ncbi:putative mucin-7 [Cocos nucifera]|uniref:Putative mucin-7 n=1 Tax=Cocos nucifera TaxID=13894 RepID=A0A8K0IWK4_COCNU|nr:putative mucin-7 [Cocos nucifera]